MYGIGLIRYCMFQWWDSISWFRPCIFLRFLPGSLMLLPCQAPPSRVVLSHVYDTFFIVNIIIMHFSTALSSVGAWMQCSVPESRTRLWCRTPLCYCDKNCAVHWVEFLPLLLFFIWLDMILMSEIGQYCVFQSLDSDIAPFEHTNRDLWCYFPSIAHRLHFPLSLSLVFKFFSLALLLPISLASPLFVLWPSRHVSYSIC